VPLVLLSYPLLDFAEQVAADTGHVLASMKSVCEKLNVTHQCALTTKKANRTLGCIPSSMGTGR